MARDTSKLFAKATEAFDRKNFDYAVDLFEQILQADPDHQKARQALRATVLKRCEINGFPSSTTSMIGSLTPKIKAGLFGMMKKWDAVVATANAYLKKDPNCVGLQLARSRALKELGHATGAITELEALMSLDRENVPAALLLGELYTETGEIQKAQECFQLVKRKKPDDRDADRALRDLAARNTIQTGRFEEAESSRDVMKDKDTVEAAERSQRIIKSEDDVKEMVAELHEQIAENPDDPATAKLWLKVGELWDKAKNLKEAAAAYKRAAEINPSDNTLRMKLGDVRIKQYEQAIRGARARLQKDPKDEQARENYRKYSTDLLKFRIVEYTRRVKDHPTDMALKFQLGLAYKDANKTKEAIGQFQATVKDPKRKIDSLLNLGVLFTKTGSHDLAVAQLNKALEDEKSEVGDIQMQLRYHLATAYEHLEQNEEALEQYNKILESDISYLDVADRVEKLRAAAK